MWIIDEGHPQESNGEFRILACIDGQDHLYVVVEGVPSTARPLYFDYTDVHLPNGEVLRMIDQGTSSDSIARKAILTTHPLPAVTTEYIDVVRMDDLHRVQASARLRRRE